MSRNKKRLGAKAFLLKEMVVRDIRSRYVGSGLGGLWAFANPILWMILYTAVFAGVLRVPIPPGFASFPEFLLAGLLPWMAIQEAISRSASALSDNAAMVKKTVFPLETLILSIVAAAIVNQIIAFFVFGIYVALIGHFSAAWVLLAIPALLLQALLTFGLASFAATVTVFVRDAMHAVGILLTVVFYATPIVYPLALVPDRFRPLIEANPLTHLVEWYRRAFTLHTWPEPGSALLLTAAAALAAFAGMTIFARARPHFADLI